MENFYSCCDAVIAIELSGSIDDLTELLKSRAAERKGSSYYEVDEVFKDFGPWKANSYHYKNYPTSQHPSGP